jgi:hypothetical protein
MNGSAAAADLLADRALWALSGVLGARRLRRTDRYVSASRSCERPIRRQLRGFAASLHE